MLCFVLVLIVLIGHVSLPFCVVSLISDCNTFDIWRVVFTRFYNIAMSNVQLTIIYVDKDILVFYPLAFVVLFSCYSLVFTTLYCMLPASA